MLFENHLEQKITHLVLTLWYLLGLFCPQDEYWEVVTLDKDGNEIDVRPEIK